MQCGQSNRRLAPFSPDSAMFGKPLLCSRMDGIFLTVKEAAKLIRHHPETVRRWARAGKVDAAFVGNKILIPLESLLALVKPLVERRAQEKKK